MDDLLSELGSNPKLDAIMPAGTRIGHVHLHVNDLHSSMDFYRDGLGFGGLFIIKSFGMGDVGLGYMPHAIAFNIWSGPNAAQAPQGSAGLRWFAIIVPDRVTLDEVQSRLKAKGHAFDAVPDGLDVRDPSGNLVKVRVG
jgi:catechol 2,3-dioxygenase